MRLGWTTLIALGAVLGEPEKLAWLEGCWTGEKDGIVSVEQWSSPSGDGLLGMHKDTKGGKMSGHEFFRIARDSSGALTYFSSPGGRPPTPFRIAEQGATRAVFANPAHDFPQRVLYWLDGETLHARIEGTLRGEALSEDWVWRRCPR